MGAEALCKSQDKFFSVSRSPAPCGIDRHAERRTLNVVHRSIVNIDGISEFRCPGAAYSMEVTVWLRHDSLLSERFELSCRP